MVNKVRRNRNNIFHRGMRGAVQVDYILAVSIFLIFFALTIQYITDYFSTVRETAVIATARSEAVSLLSIADRNFEPQTWPQIANISNDLVLLMHFNNNTLDYSSKGNNGTATGANCSASAAGKFFSGCSFDGADDYVNVPDSDSLDITTAITIEAWVMFKGAGSNDFNAVIAKQAAASSTNGYSLFVYNNTRRVLFAVNATIGSNNYIVSTNAVADNGWTHVAAIYNGTHQLMYLDGILDSTETTSVSAIITNTQPLYIGGQVGSSYRYFNGTIDEVAIYNRSLSASEINEHYQQSLNRIGLRTEAFRFFVIVNNTKPNLVNTSENATALNLVNELVRFNLSAFGFAGIDYNSVVIYNGTNHEVPFQINGSNITFSANVTANASRQFTVYFDDDSLFGEKSQNVITDVDNLTETFLPAERISVLQYEKLRQLNQSNYTNVRSKADVESSFRIKLTDADANATFMDFGGDVPRKGNIVALQRYAVFQNSTAGIRNGKMTIQAW